MAVREDLAHRGGMNSSGLIREGLYCVSHICFGLAFLAMSAASVKVLIVFSRAFLQHFSGSAVHSFAAEGLRPAPYPDKVFAGTGVGGIDQLQTFAGRPQNHVRCQNGTFLCLDDLAFLQAAP